MKKNSMHDPAKTTLIFADSEDNEYEVPLLDLQEMGWPCDDDGEDMTVIGVKVD